SAFERELAVHRLTSIAEQMGDALERSAISTNVKERRDYSCGVLDAEGRLVASAAHVPVHLGALDACVQRVVDVLGGLRPGDVAITNHPAFGGSHLPDVTIVQAAFDDRGERLGYVASRAHHAEIGGSAPGSMPPNATTLDEEGVPIPPTRLLREGHNGLPNLERLLRSHRFPSRSVDDNIADVLAAIAAGRGGVRSIEREAREIGADRMRSAMRWIIEHTATLVRQAIAAREISSELVIETMDDGAEIHIAVRPERDGLMVDLTGTSGVRAGNTNAPLAVTRSAIAYVVRLLLDRPIPINAGLLDPIRVLAPEGCFVHPRFDPALGSLPAVAGGNVETSQRIAEGLIRALRLAAAGPGTMNNLLLGNEVASVYETIGGGAGATYGHAGASGVHTHMTNTAITDAEVLEQRHPLRVHRFSLRSDSGGPGRWRGGDGLVREIEALEPLRVTVLSQRRTHGAPGAVGGGEGSTGVHTVLRFEGDEETLDWASGASLRAGDRVVMRTPGGGGWGDPASVQSK
ncbi:MAG: hydantoinase B/oxoprolinase family protein, partial [Planctomycetota bacterium]